MLARKKTSKQGKSLPSEWLESLNRLLNETYKSECKQNGRYFDVYGQVYPEELLLTVSYLSEKDEYLSPITCFLSCEPDQMATEEKVKETQANFIDIVGLFFDEIFADSEWDEFEPTWQEVSHKNQNYFYKLSRENINLTLEADKLLGEEFQDLEEETDH
ncbi:hypothetical protein [Peredibacter starrii]|uniref:DUF4303 domain-containing protein n=1 Tax=Peredibacter starrii TaxID=28202 RepID=A0AAX4HMP8_9BACT|nr:hypothetical protein [Peredibacter starrii]WPU64486.1 hypothetical protein SOO65_17465 [Peredibacter starrii]